MVVKKWLVRIPDEDLRWVREKAARESVKQNKNVSMNTVIVETLQKAREVDSKSLSKKTRR